MTHKIDELSHKLTDLQRNAKHIEEERDSLTTVVRLLAVESNHSSYENKMQAVNTNNNEPHKAGNHDLIQSREAVNKNIKLNNRYSGLNDTVVISEDPDESAKEENLNSNNKQTELKKKKRQRKGKKKQKPEDILHEEVNLEDKENLEENIPNSISTMLRHR